MNDWIIKYWVETAFTGITSGLLILIKYLKSKHKKQTECQILLENERKRIEELKDAEIQILKLGVQALLRNEIQRACYEYFDKGFYTFEEYDNIENMYNQYHALGGNGPITNLFKKLKKLEIRKEGDAYD